MSSNSSNDDPDPLYHSSIRTSERYVVSEDHAGTWKIVDTTTGLPAATNGRDFVQLSKVDAKDLADELNECDAQGGDPLV
jgi:hypothetical protein